MRLLFFGDGAWATNSLRRLGRDGWDVLAVVVRTKPTDPEFLATASALELPILQPENVNSPEFISQVAAFRPDLNISVSYDQILHRPMFNLAPRGFINFHAGKLPYYRGRNVINWAIINGETELGLTAHYVDAGIDTGDIILQRTIPIALNDTYADVLKAAIAAFPDLVADTLGQIAADQAMRQSQCQQLGTYYASRGEGDEELDWSDTSFNLNNKIRAITHPGPGATTKLGEQRLIIWRAFYEQSWPEYIATPGQVVGRRLGEGVLVKTGDSTLLVKEVQLGDSEAFVPNWRIGTRLGINQHLEMKSLRREIEELKRLICRSEQNAP